MELISMREYARRRGVALSAVQQAIRYGRITLVDGKIDPVASDADWEASTTPGEKRGKKPKRGKVATTEPKSAKRGAKSVQDPKGKPPETPQSLAEEKMWHEHFQRKAKALKVAEMEGRLVSAAKVEKEWYEMCRTIRSNIMNIPARISAVLASLTDPHEVHQRLEAELEQVLTGIADAA